NVQRAAADGEGNAILLQKPRLWKKPKWPKRDGRVLVIVVRHVPLPPDRESKALTVIYQIRTFSKLAEPTQFGRHCAASAGRKRLLLRNTPEKLTAYDKSAARHRLRAADVSPCHFRSPSVIQARINSSVS